MRLSSWAFWSRNSFSRLSNALRQPSSSGAARAVLASAPSAAAAARTVILCMDSLSFLSMREPCGPARMKGTRPRSAGDAGYAREGGPRGAWLRRGSDATGIRASGDSRASMTGRNAASCGAPNVSETPIVVTAKQTEQ